jgi:hypothetical protein
MAGGGGVVDFVCLGVSLTHRYKTLSASCRAHALPLALAMPPAWSVTT